MSFFQNAVLNKYLKTLNLAQIQSAYKKFAAYFHNPEIQNNIREAKEEQFQEGFLRELFVNIFGYAINPEPNFNLTTEFKNLTGAKKADGAILIEGKAVAVIELKGTAIRQLDKINEQAFNYKNNQTDCIYVITSNFEKLRFYIHNSVDHLEFNLFTLTENEFKLLWLCLSAECLLKGVPAKVKEESSLEEENITKYLYKDYANFRTELWQNMVPINPQVDQLTLFKKTQKLLDRFLFVFFAEDGGLLPPNSISRMVERWQLLKDEDAFKPLYDIFKQFFGYINTGRKGKNDNDDIFAFNGGLFLADEILDNIRIDDEVLEKHIKKLSSYDFQSEVDVNILGHIFENSLNEIENVKAQIEGQETDKSKSKRKKDGIFYTPRYITKYIVENTIGKLCEEKKAELNIIDEEYAKGRRNRKKETLIKLDDQLKAYRDWLLNITICDPACGSGAFLNQALEFLIEEHRYIDELQAQLLGSSVIFPDVENHILEKNIFGVDINDESVEIARLSLWLRTAQRGRKLTSLNNNIKCGNSLIDDPAVAGDKAFNWQKEFPDIFKKKEKKAWHVVFCLHNSRYSKFTDGLTRRWEYMPGLLGYTHPSLTPKEEEILAECLATTVEEKNLNILECNICEDHVHAIMVCEQEELENNMRLWKGRSAYLYNRLVFPSVEKRQHDENYKRDYSDGTIQKFWAKSYHATLIESQEQLFNTIHYIRNNREKHGLSSLITPSSASGSQTKANDNKKPSADVFRGDSGVGHSNSGNSEVDHSYCDSSNSDNSDSHNLYDGPSNDDPSNDDPSNDDPSNDDPSNDGLTRHLAKPRHLAKIGASTDGKSTDGKSTDSASNDGLTRQLKRICCTYEHAFRTEYKGGFDVVIGNPPYGAKFTEKEKEFCKKEFPKSTEGKVDSYRIFIEKCFRLGTSNSLISLITPNTFLYNLQSFPLRQLILESTNIYDAVELRKNIFEDAPDVITVIISFENILKENYSFRARVAYPEIPYFDINNSSWAIDQIIPIEYLKKDKDLKINLRSNFNFASINEQLSKFNILGDFFNLKQGTKPYGVKEGKEVELLSKVKISNSWEKAINGRNISRYHLEFENDYVLRSKDLHSVLPVETISNEKIYFQRMRKISLFPRIVACFDNDNIHGLYTCSVITKKSDCKLDLKYLLCLLNSYLVNLWYKYFDTDIEIKLTSVRQIPVPDITLEQQAIFIEMADILLEKNKEHKDLLSKFIKLLSSKFPALKITNKLQGWPSLNFKLFTQELEKQKIKLPLSEQAEWIDYFEKEKQKALTLKSEIEKTDKEIDRMVYELYQLTPEEIKIVEGKQ